MSESEQAAVTTQPDGPFPSLVDPVAPARPRTEPGRIRLLTPEEILQRPDPEYLVHDMLVEGGFAAISGKPGTYKTFAALGLGFSVATGLPFAGREVRRGCVAYVRGRGEG